MTKVIRNREGLYLREDGTWTAEFQEAKIFQSLNNVFAAKLRFQIENAYLVLVVNEEPSREYDIVLSL